MPTQILAVGTSALNSSDVVVAEGSSLTVAIKDDAGPGTANYAKVDILLKDDEGRYFKVDALSARKPAMVIQGAGTYRFSRPAGGPACGVFSG